MANEAFSTRDTMHYHSRAIRAGLKASILRLDKAKAHIPLPLTSKTNESVQQEWVAPTASLDFLKVRHVDMLHNPDFTGGIYPLLVSSQRIEVCIIIIMHVNCDAYR